MTRRSTIFGIGIAGLVLFLGMAVQLAPGCTLEENNTLDWMESECLACKSEAQTRMCADGEDNDEDGLVDCVDPDCDGIGCCGGAGPEDTDEACSDGCDNDGNGYTDCEDWSCWKWNPDLTACKTDEKTDENTPETCSDGLDNNWNGFFDCDDYSCSESPEVFFCEGNDITCADGVDNDGNGYVDCKDFSCSKNSNVTVCD